MRLKPERSVFHTTSFPRRFHNNTESRFCQAKYPILRQAMPHNPATAGALRHHQPSPTYLSTAYPQKRSVLSGISRKQGISAKNDSSANLRAETDGYSHRNCHATPIPPKITH